MQVPEKEVNRVPNRDWSDVVITFKHELSDSQFKFVKKQLEEQLFATDEISAKMPLIIGSDCTVQRI